MVQQRPGAPASLVALGGSFLTILRCNIYTMWNYFQNMRYKAAIITMNSSFTKYFAKVCIFKLCQTGLVCFSINPSFFVTLHNEFSSCRGFPSTVGHQTRVHTSVLWAHMANLQEMHSWSLKHVIVIWWLDLLFSLIEETQRMNVSTLPARDPTCDFKYCLIMSHLIPLHQWLGSPRDLGREFATLSNFEIQARRFSHKLWGAFTPDTGSILYCRNTHRSTGDKREKMYVMLLIHKTKPRNINVLLEHAISFKISPVMSSGGWQQWQKC